MSTLTFPDEHRYDGHKVLVWIQVLGRSIELKLEVVLDTGAAISVLNRDLVRVLNLNVESGEAIDLMVANKQATRAYVHLIDIEFLGRRLTIPAAICPDWDTQNLLGMRGFFDQMIVAFDHANRTIHF
jgi:predicted aspartyl protease